MKDPCNPKGPKIPSWIEAYSDENDGNGYSQTTFCPRYFDLKSLGTVISNGLAETDTYDKYDLTKYDNRGVFPERLCMLHENSTFPIK